MKLDRDKQLELGLDCDGKTIEIGVPKAMMRYTAGVVLRERERLARVFESHMPEVAQAIRDMAYDDKVFKWAGPETDLDVSPKSVEQRKREKADSEKADSD